MKKKLSQKVLDHIKGSNWRMDDEVQAAIELLAETPLTSETPGIHADLLVDMLILNARQIMKREGFEIGGEI